ncbi:hypothetical protein BDF21DRAFT_464711 [Thamnidium elegans]|uniref:TRP C-terminal domain-containing protein n=1 Tax=Thamnidium elegans TaxID=101142 RepID=A0A8H7SPX7_9FUNG|nr:hypothetical protein INT48_005713 [Thamnidium elegans]KAI8075514.1 hypothetical protein BDF21DRAFT_464711 [Thamnidium elegans]
MRFLLNLVLLLILWTPLRNAQSIDSVWFPSNNFTLCSQGQFDVSSVNRYFDVTTSSYSFNFTSTSNTTVTNLNQQGSTYSSSRMEIKFGFESIHTQPQRLCLDSIEECPLIPQTNFTIQRSYNLSHIPLYPLADITAQYTATAADSNNLVCIRFAPVGYQHPTWRKIFTWLPISFTITAAMISFIASLKVFNDSSSYDMFLFSSNYALLPGILRLKTPGFFDLIFYCQFIVTVGQFNIDYPRFHALFTSNFSWSFLLFNQSGWLHGLMDTLFAGSSSGAVIDTSVAGYSINKRQQELINGTDTNVIRVAGTGMSDFSIASGIDINAMFFTMMVYLLIIIGSCLILCFVGWIVLLISTTSVFNDNPDSKTKSKRMLDFTIGVLVRILSLAYVPMMTLSFYQLMIPSYWYITVLAAGFVMIPFLFYGFVAIKLLQIRPASFIFTEIQLLLRYGSLYNTFTDDKFNFFILVIVYKSLIAAMIGLFQTSGLAQIILVILAECTLMIAIMIKLPYSDGQVNFIHVTVSFIRLVVLALNIAFLPTIEATVLVKQYVGYVQMSLHCLVFFVFLTLQIKNIVIIATGLGEDELDETGKPPARMIMWRKKRAPHQLHIHSSTTLMSTTTNSAVLRSQTASFYMNNNTSNRNSNRLTGDSQTLDMFTNYYTNNNNSSSTTAALKPDEVIRQKELVANNGNMLQQYPELVADYLNTTVQASSSRVYKLDDEIVPVNEPLLVESINVQKSHLPSSPPPPLPKHIVLNNDSTYSPPHQPSPTSILIQEDV